MGSICSTTRGRPNSKVDEEPSLSHLIDAADGSGFSSNQGRKNRESYFVIDENIRMSPGRSAASKAHEVSSIWGRAGVIGLEKAVEVLDNLGSTMSHLNSGSGFMYGTNQRGNKISILAFEVANTITKGGSLMQSLSRDTVQQLKSEILSSEGVQTLVSTDMQQLMTIAAADKREELDAFCREVARFGDMCRDPQWHNLGRYFQKLDSDFTHHPGLKEDAEAKMQHLLTLANHTAELYHELNALDRFESDYQRKVKEEESISGSRREERFTSLHGELKRQRKLVESLKRKTLWSKNLDEVVEQLVDIITSLSKDFQEAFGPSDINVNDRNRYQAHQRLGALGLSLHYANIINLIDNAVSRPMSFPTATRDTIYHALPASVKAALRSRLESFNFRKELSGAQIKAEMQKILQWLVPVAENTTKAHQGFGWVGEWAISSNDFNKPAQRANMARILTLHHADKEKTDEIILQLSVWLHHLGIQVKSWGLGGKTVKPAHQATQRYKHASLEKKTNLPLSPLSEDDRRALEAIGPRQMVLRRSKSHGYATEKARKGRMTRSRSYDDSQNKDFGTGLDVPVDRTRVLDVIDGLDIVDRSFPVDLFYL